MTDSPQKPSIKAVLFDFMGTCLDWHSSVVSSFPRELSEDVKSRLALDWRQAYYEANTDLIHRGQPPEDIDDTLRRSLNLLLDKDPSLRDLFTDELTTHAVAAWHHQRAWPDVVGALKKLRARGYELFVHANGTTQLQLDLVRHAGLVGECGFDMLFASNLLGVYKPDPASFEKALRLIKRRPEECVMVAAHAYDTRGAKAVGMRTVYVHRWTDDYFEDQEKIKREGFDAYLEDMGDLDLVISKL